MPFSIRAAFGLVLWIAALFPLVLYGVHRFSPVSAVQIALVAEGAVRATLWFGTLAALVATVLYPPFLPSLRIGLRRLKGRLATDQGPMRHAQERLAHLETAPDHVIVGRALMQQGNLPQAVAHLRRAVELDPEHAGSHYHLALALARHGDPAGAAQQFTETVARDPGHAFGQAMLELGVTYERGGADDHAIEVLQRYHEQFGESRRSNYHLARAFARSGKSAEARTLLQRVAATADVGHQLSLDDQLLRARARVALVLDRFRG